MRKRQIWAIIGAALVAALAGGLALTNPKQESYETFATGALTSYAGENLCPKVPFLGQAQCQVFLQTNQAEIKRLVARNTQRHNFIFFSVYITELSVGSELPAVIGSLIPSYEFGTVGVFQKFYVYRAKQM